MNLMDRRAMLMAQTQAQPADPWAAVFAAISNGTYTTKYQIGDTVPLDLGTEGVVNMQIVAFDSDPLASGSGYAPITWISVECLKTPHRMNPALAGESGNRTEGTGTIGGWEKCEMQAYLKETIKPLIPANVRAAIKPVTKYSKIIDTSGTTVNDVTSTDDVWIPSSREANVSNEETSGPNYNTIFKGTATRKKNKTGQSNATTWWLRTAYNDGSFRKVDSSGFHGSSGSTGSFSIALGFCT